MFSSLSNLSFTKNIKLLFATTELNSEINLKIGQELFKLWTKLTASPFGSQCVHDQYFNCATCMSVNSLITKLLNRVKGQITSHSSANPLIGGPSHTYSFSELLAQAFIENNCLRRRLLFPTTNAERTKTETISAPK